MPSTQVTEAQAKLTIVQSRVRKALADADTGAKEDNGNPVLDLTKVKSYGDSLSAIEISEHIQKDDAEMNVLFDELKSVKDAEDALAKMSKPVGIKGLR